MSKQPDFQLPIIVIKKSHATHSAIGESKSDLRNNTDMAIRLDSLVNSSSNVNSKLFDKDKENNLIQSTEGLQNQSNTAVFLMKKKQLFEAYENLEKQKALFKE